MSFGIGAAIAEVSGALAQPVKIAAKKRGTKQRKGGITMAAR
jgi:hypothetical protein